MPSWSVFERRGLPPAAGGAVAPEPGQHAIGERAADRVRGERGAEGDGGDREGGRRGGAALLEQLPEVGGQSGVDGGRGAAPGVELAQGAGVGGAGVGAQGMCGQPARGRRAGGERGRIWRVFLGWMAVYFLPHNCNYAVVRCVFARVPAMSRKRESPYTKRITIALTPALDAALRAGSDKYDVAVAVLARGAIEQGLKLELDARRKQAKQARHKPRQSARQPDPPPAPSGPSDSAPPETPSLDDDDW